MNGPQHYRNAEVLAGQAEDADPEHAMLLATLAVAHATMAQAAATVNLRAHWTEWQTVTGGGM